MKCVETGQNCTTVPCASCPRAPRPGPGTAGDAAPPRLGVPPPQWVTSWPHWHGIDGNVTVVPKADYDQLAADFGDCKPWLKDGETVVQALQRKHDDTTVVLSQLVAAIRRAEAAERIACTAENRKTCSFAQSESEPEGYPGIAHDFEKMRSALKDLLDQVESLDSYGLTCDVETYKAQSNWDDAIATAAAVLKRTPAWQPSAPVCVSAAPIPVCYGIFNAAGEMHMSESCISTNQGSLNDEAECLDDSQPEAGWKVLPMYLAPFSSSPNRGNDK